MPRARTSGSKIEMNGNVGIDLREAPATPPPTPKRLNLTSISCSDARDESESKPPEAEAKTLHSSFQIPSRIPQTQLLTPKSDSKLPNKLPRPLHNPVSPSRGRCARRRSKNDEIEGYCRQHLPKPEVGTKIKLSSGPLGQVSPQPQPDVSTSYLTAAESISNPDLPPATTAPLSGLRSPTISSRPLYYPSPLRSVTQRMPGEYPLSPRLEGTPAEPTSPCTASAPPAGLESSPLPEVQPTPASPLRDTNSAVQCYGITRAGRRCNQRVRGGPALLYQSPEVHVERYCHHHIPVILRPSGFHSLATGEWIEFSDWVEDYLQPATQAALRAEMVKYVSDSDEDGYIYAYEIRSSRTRNEFHIKIGRSVNFIRRLDDWSKQCTSREPIVRGWWPDNSSANHPNLLPGMINPGEKGKYCHRLERLIHLELADIALNSTHLTPYFKKQASAQRANIHTRRSKTHSSSKPKEKPSSRHVKKPCPDCGKRHKEIFTLERGTSSKLRGQEWEGIVKPIIEKWGRFVAEHASKRR